MWFPWKPCIQQASSCIFLLATIWVIIWMGSTIAHFQGRGQLIHVLISMSDKGRWGGWGGDKSWRGRGVSPANHFRHFHETLASTFQLPFIMDTHTYTRAQGKNYSTVWYLPRHTHTHTHTHTASFSLFIHLALFLSLSVCLLTVLGECESHQ